MLLLRAPRHTQERLRHRHTHRVPEARDELLTCSDLLPWLSAQKWHPDRWASDPGAAGEANRRFQRIQEAYSVLSDKGKKAMYDAGLFDPLDDDDQDFSDFMQEMLVMMDNVKNEKPDTLEDLQKMLEDIVNGGDGAGGGVGGRMPPPADGARRTRVAPYPQPQQARHR